MTKTKKNKELGVPAVVGCIPWKNVTPEDPMFLGGFNEGGFMCLEEVDGEFYSHFSGNSMGSISEEVHEPEQEARLPLNSGKERKSTRKRKRKREEVHVEDRKTGLASSSAKELKSNKKTKKDRVHAKDEDKCKHNKGAEDDWKLNEASGSEASPHTGRGQIIGDDPNTRDFQQIMVEETGQECDDHCDQDDVDTLNERLPAWVELRLHWRILKALATLNFIEPTPIQKACIPAAAHQGKDIIGAAETGSGKTLAYVIPILQRLLDEDEKYSGSRVPNVCDNFLSEIRAKGPLRALILAPTRELSLQVCDHFRMVAKYTTIKVVPIVGGISHQKQERLLKQRPQVIVGTPGRLWELMNAGEQHLIELDSLSFFVLDEADRMVEKGHFQELQSIMSMLPTEERYATAITEVDSGFKSGSNDAKRKVRRQNFIFSATLTLPAGFRKKLKKGYLPIKQLPENDETSIASLSQRARIRHNAAIVDLTSQNIVADKLQESFIKCRDDEKDMFLYYILKLHGHGRAVIFCTSIAAVRHTAAILSLLQIQAWPLHAQMQQRQRLKAMDRFRKNENSFLISTDVAARGLDIPDIRTVIHYQLPHSAGVYVHRSGRTARASKDGCSILLVSPTDQAKYDALCRALSKKDGLPAFPINRAYIPAIAKRIRLVHKIDVLLRKNMQTKAKINWFKKNADILGVDMESSDEEQKITHTKRASLELKQLQQELKTMLEEPLEPKSFSHLFITGAGISPLVADQLKNYASQKMHRRMGQSLKIEKKSGILSEKRQQQLVVIGQETVEPLAVLRMSTKA